MGIGEVKGIPEDRDCEIQFEIGSSKEGLENYQTKARLRVGHEVAQIPLLPGPDEGYTAIPRVPEETDETSETRRLRAGVAH